MAGLTRAQIAEKKARLAAEAVNQAAVGTLPAPVEIPTGIGTKLPVGMPSSVPDGAISAAPTKPWEKNVGNKPWRRDITALTKKDRDNHCRWVNNDSIDSRLERGYEIASPDKWGQPADKIIDDASPLGRRIVRRHMTLMCIPLEGKRYYEKANEEIIRSRKRDAKDMVKKQAEELLTKAGFAVQIVEKSKVEKDGHAVN